MKKLIISIIAVAMMLSACEEKSIIEIENEIKNDEMKKGSESIEGLLASTSGSKEWTLMGDFILNSIQAKPGGEYQHGGSAMIWGDKYHDTIVDGGDITIADIVVEYYSDPYYSYIFSESRYDNTTNSFPNYNPTFGATADWKMVGDSANGVSAIDEDIYIPKEFVLTNSLSGWDHPIDNSQDYTLTWETDASNPNGKVAIVLEHSWFHSQEIDSTISATEIDWSVITDDDGSFTIPSTVLDDYPDNAMIIIRAGRGKMDYVTKPEGKYRFFTVCYINYMFLAY